MADPARTLLFIEARIRKGDNQQVSARAREERRNFEEMIGGIRKRGMGVGRGGKNALGSSTMQIVGFYFTAVTTSWNIFPCY